MKEESAEVIYTNFSRMRDYLQEKTNCTVEEANDYINIIYDLFFTKGVPTRYSMQTIIQVVRDEQNKNRKSEETIW